MGREKHWNIKQGTTISLSFGGFCFLDYQKGKPRNNILGSCIKTEAMWFEVGPTTNGCTSACERPEPETRVYSCHPPWFLQCPPASTHKLCSRSSASWLSSLRTSQLASPSVIGSLELAMSASYRFLGTKFLM